MPPRRRQQHRNQQPSRRKAPVDAHLGSTKTKPPFPMNLFTSNSAFMVIGVGVMIFGLLAVFAFSSRNSGNESDRSDTPATNTPTGDQATATAAASATAAAGAPQQFDEAEQVVDGAANTYRATISTPKGDFVLDLWADIAPDTVNSFVFLAQQGYFDNTTFHRVIRDPRPFVIQGGDPTGTGSGGPGYLTEEEPNDRLNLRGTVSMAKTPGATAFGSQFFVNLEDNPDLDDPSTQSGQFFPFAEVIEGLDVVDEIREGDAITTITIEEIPIPGAATATPAGGDAEDTPAESATATAAE